MNFHLLPRTLELEIHGAMKLNKRVGYQLSVTAQSGGKLTANKKDITAKHIVFVHTMLS